MFVLASVDIDIQNNDDGSVPDLADRNQDDSSEEGYVGEAYKLDDNDMSVLIGLDGVDHGKSTKASVRKTAKQDHPGKKDL